MRGSKETRRGVFEGSLGPIREACGSKLLTFISYSLKAAPSIMNFEFSGHAYSPDKFLDGSFV